MVHNSGSTGSHPMYWSTFVGGIEKYFTMIPYEQQFKPPRSRFTPSKRKYEILFFLKSKLPQKAYSLMAKILFSKNMKKNADRLKKINQKGKMVNYIMSHFTLNEWIFDHPILKEFNEIMNEEERELFFLSLKEVSFN